jgi:hypothetical protein
MGRIKDLLKPTGKFKVSKVFVNKRNGQMMIMLPKKKVKSIPSKVEVTYW